MDRNAKSRENKGLFQWEKRATAWSIYWLLTDYCTERLKRNLFMLSHTLSILWSLCWTVVYSCENSWQEAAETCIFGEPACELEWMVLLSRLRFPEDSLWIQQDFFVFVFCFLMCCTLMGRFHTNLLGFFFSSPLRECDAEICKFTWWKCFVKRHDGVRHVSTAIQLLYVHILQKRYFFFFFWNLCLDVNISLINVYLNPSSGVGPCLFQLKWKEMSE